MRGILNELYKWGGMGLIGLGIFIVVAAAFGDRDSVLYRYWARYTSGLERKLRPMFIFTPGRMITFGNFFLSDAVRTSIDPNDPIWMTAAVKYSLASAFFLMPSSWRLKAAVLSASNFLSLS